MRREEEKEGRLKVQRWRYNTFKIDLFSQMVLCVILWAAVGTFEVDALTETSEESPIIIPLQLWPWQERSAVVY